ncbi:hypothetical protein VOLCADRAFT_60953 [Volvox carteri f. nagariensis]|uniref:EF-hand domain-containing protein n=1 Tax=Volvox carteri f. nagariensis TaxID=3068 RepID=D8TX10_VOLCA|nr:uncharacterized protein VOLCADRAFT_60953 [Volvox carteri f. nagariensis]EFJ47829.1 hypothetical protein VOLCADRAFT_60953 [Volvox carteri f. nagariensis]|eukprot:XP_002950935.1 hypothetical protein VOLCADRAFT_60953 [Volvox carteri f. nagariensis]
MTALKLALASLQHAPLRRDGRSPATRAVQLASTLADLCAAGLPLDAAAMCAGVVSEAADLGALRADVIRAQLGPEVAALVHDMLRVRQAPRRIELLDDEGASAVREWCLAFHDVRSCVVEVVGWWDELQHLGGRPLFEQQAIALETLQIGAPLGHALGLGALSAVMEDMCLKVLFPESYTSTSAWLRGLLDPAEDLLFSAQQRLLSALDEHPDFGKLSGGLLVKARTKSLFSVMKKLLHLGDMARGGRSREELYDLLGMRAIVKPPDFLPPAEAEAAATKACYIVQDVACKLWRPIPSRSKDYIVSPKPNGYQSIHLTSAAAIAAAEAAAGGPLCVELQIRTAAMDIAAESGDAAHAVYKGGLDARTARQLQAQRLLLFSSLGSLDEVEDVPLAIGLGQQDAAAAAEQLFRHLDVNGDGRLSLDEVRQALTDLAAPSSERDAAALLAALDRNGDGGVSMEEFVEGLGPGGRLDSRRRQT